MKLPAPEAEALAFPYLRYSSNPQEDGDSLRRQTALYEGWLKRHPCARLDNSLRLVDRAVSAFGSAHRTNQKHALARFFDLIKRGRVPIGSYLLIENLDRLSREEAIESLPVVLSLITAGIRIVQLAPEVVYDRDMEQGTLFVLVAELTRANAESQRKSDLVGPAWAQKKKDAREKGTPHGHNTPAWLELVDGQYRVKEQAARIIRLIFRWAAEGQGTRTIAARLQREGHPVISRPRKQRHSDKRLVRWGQFWSRSYVALLLGDRRVLGEYQPCKGSGRLHPDGAPIPNYFPAIITEAEWFAAQSAKAGRQHHCGRSPRAGAAENPFAGLLWCARDRCKLHVQTRGPNGAAGQIRKFLVSAQACDAGLKAHWCSFPLEPFTSELLNQLRELQAAELFADSGAARVTELNGRLQRVEKRLQIARAGFRADDERSLEWAEEITQASREKSALNAELREASQRALHPLSTTWSDAITLARHEEPERLRAALLQTISSIWCLFVARSRSQARLAFAQVWFQGEPAPYRNYFILYEPCPPRGRRSARWRSGDVPGIALPQDLDLRQPDQARELYDDLLAQKEWRIGKADDAHQ